MNRRHASRVAVVEDVAAAMLSATGRPRIILE